MSLNERCRFTLNRGNPQRADQFVVDPEALPVTEDEFYFDHVIDTYPYPIASIYSRLGTWECMESPERKFNCILDSAEAVSRFLFALVLCRCRDYAENSATPSPGFIFNSRFHADLGQPSWGLWMQYAREGLGWLLDSTNPPPLLETELAGFFFTHPHKTAPSDAGKALDQILRIRNDIQHKRRKIHTEDEFAEACEETDPKLKLVIHSLDFLSNYHLDVVKRIDVNKRRHQDPKFNHFLERIRGDRGRFRGVTDNSSPTVLENHSVLFRYQRDPKIYLNLDPFLIREEKAGIAPDLFFFNGMKNPNSIRYVACKHGGGFESGACARATELADEMRNILQRLAAPLETSFAE